MNNKILFYTYPPIEYPYVLRNVRQKGRDYAEHEIVDIGVYELLKEPHQYSEKTLQSYLDCNTSGLKVVPDYPDIFKEHSLEMDIDNVVESKLLMKKYYNPKDRHQMPVIQGYFDDPYSFEDYSEWFKSKYTDNPEVIGIGTVCKLSNKQNLLKTLHIIRRQFPNAWIHAFGLSIRYLREARGMITSFDSTAWTFPRTSGRPSCKNKEMRIEYFQEYLELYERYSVQYQPLEYFYNE